MLAGTITNLHNQFSPVAGVFPPLACKQKSQVLTCRRGPFNKAPSRWSLSGNLRSGQRLICGTEAPLPQPGVESLEGWVVEWNIDKSLDCIRLSTILMPLNATNGSGQQNRIAYGRNQLTLVLGVLRSSLQTHQPAG